jgi:hypothetical protein
MTPDELVDRVRKSVDGVEIDAGPRDAALALLRAGMTIVGIAMRRPCYRLRLADPREALPEHSPARRRPADVRPSGESRGQTRYTPNSIPNRRAN